MLRSTLAPRAALRPAERRCRGRALAAAPSPPASTLDSPTPGFFIDEAAMLASSTFPISPAALVAKTKRVLVANFGATEPELLAEDFAFLGPVVGPLSKSVFVAAFSSFEIKDGFPDMQFRYHDFRVDPFEPSRVWYTARAVGTHTGVLARTLQPTGLVVESPPQACSMVFNAEGKCTKITIGVVMDRQLGNTGGLGGLFGILFAIGSPLPFPEAQPWKMSLRYRLFNAAGTVLPKLLAKLPGKKETAASS